MARSAQALLKGVDALAAGKVARTWRKPGAKQGAEQGSSVKYASTPHEIGAGSYAIHSKHEPSCLQCRVWRRCRALMRQRQARWRAHGANLWQSKAHSKAPSRWHAPVGDASPRAAAFRVAACGGHRAAAPKAGVVSASHAFDHALVCAPARGLPAPPLFVALRHASPHSTPFRPDSRWRSRRSWVKKRSCFQGFSGATKFMVSFPCPGQAPPRGFQQVQPRCPP